MTLSSDAAHSSNAVSADQIADLFDSLGLRATRPRRMIGARIAAMAASCADFATEELWHELQKEDSGIGRATVFRSVELLVKHGVLDRVPLSDGRHRYRVCGSDHHHHHVTCRTCSRVVEIDECLSPELLSAIASSTQFAIEGHSLELFGQCPVCQEPA